MDLPTCRMGRLPKPGQRLMMKEISCSSTELERYKNDYGFSRFTGFYETGGMAGTWCFLVREGKLIELTCTDRYSCDSAMYSTDYMRSVECVCGTQYFF